MDTVKELVRNVTIIVLIAGFLEMLLPSSEMKRFVKMVMGLFVLVSILNPLVSLFHQEPVSEVFAWQDPAGETELNSIMNKGDQVSRDMEKKAAAMYARSMAKQMETIVELVKGVAWVNADVEIKETGKQPDYAKIEKVCLVIGTGDGQKKSTVEPVDIKILERNQTAVAQSGTEDIKRQVTEALKNFYNLKENQIDLVFSAQ